MAPDDKYHNMVAAYKACEAAGVEVPDEIQDYFNYEHPDQNPPGTPILLNYHKSKCLTDYCTDNRNGYTLDLSKLPAHVRYLQIYLS